MPVVTQSSITKISLKELKIAFGIKGRVVKFAVPSRGNEKLPDKAWQENAILLIETEGDE